MLVPHCCGTDLPRRFLIARRFDQNAALDQFREATQFRSDKVVVRLYDVMEVVVFEQTRHFVRFHYPHLVTFVAQH